MSLAVRFHGTCLLTRTPPLDQHELTEGPSFRAYNWYSLPDSNEPTGIEYVPMFHDQGALSGFTTNSAKWAGLGVKNLLSLNEPDVS